LIINIIPLDGVEFNSLTTAARFHLASPCITLGLGIVRQNDVKTGQVTLLTPLTSLAGVDTLRLGDVIVDPLTFRDQLIKPES
jgi:hypothetical protein